MKKDKIITLRLTQELYEKYLHAIGSDMSLSQFIRQALEDTLSPSPATIKPFGTSDIQSDIISYIKSKSAQDLTCSICHRHIPMNTTMIIGLRDTKSLIFCIYCKQL